MTLGGVQKNKTPRGTTIDEPTPSVERALLPTPLQPLAVTRSLSLASSSLMVPSPHHGNQSMSFNMELSPATPASTTADTSVSMLSPISDTVQLPTSQSLMMNVPPISLRSLVSPSNSSRGRSAQTSSSHPSSARSNHTPIAATASTVTTNSSATTSSNSTNVLPSSVLLPPLPLSTLNLSTSSSTSISPRTPSVSMNGDGHTTPRSILTPTRPSTMMTPRTSNTVTTVASDVRSPRSRSASTGTQPGNTSINGMTSPRASSPLPSSSLQHSHAFAAPSVAEAQQMMWSTGRVTFAQLLAVMYPENTADERKLMLGLVFNPVTKDTVTGIQRVFDRLDTQFQGSC
jgi:hypothetical protein